MNLSLPPEAYSALAALKGQAAAMSIDLSKDGADAMVIDRPALATAQQAMLHYRDWTRRIWTAIWYQESGPTIPEADDHWLERTFAAKSGPLETSDIPEQTRCRLFIYDAENGVIGNYKRGFRSAADAARWLAQRSNRLDWERTIGFRFSFWGDPSDYVIADRQGAAAKPPAI